MMQSWFKDAKLGIFIHWGIYAVDGVAESWAFFNGEMSHEEYMRQLDGFTASKWNPQQWADLFVRAGAKYVVMTTKHHDGVALWHTKQSELNVVESTPARRDLLTPYCEAMRSRELRVGFYSSHLDWSHPDYASIGSDDPKANSFAYRKGASDLVAWERFLKFHRAQLDELCTQFGAIDLMWFDGDWERDAETWRMAELRNCLHDRQPDMILNSRMRGHGDYETPEQGMPVEAPNGPWEFCMTINDSWGFQQSDTNYKSPEMVIRIFCEIIGMGGNLLLDVGPMEDGTIPPEQVSVLETLGAWIAKNSSAIYSTRAGLPPGHFFGPSTLSGDGRTLNLILFDRPRRLTQVRGLRTEVVSARILASGHELAHRRVGGAEWMSVPGVLWIDIPEAAILDEVMVIELMLAGPLDVYRGAGQGIEQN